MNRVEDILDSDMDLTTYHNDFRHLPIAIRPIKTDKIKYWEPDNSRFKRKKSENYRKIWRTKQSYDRRDALLSYLRSRPQCHF